MVYWIDIHQDPRWKSNEEAEKRPEIDCATVGFFTKKDKEAIYLSHTVSASERDQTVIPLGVVSKITQLFKDEDNDLQGSGKGNGADSKKTRIQSQEKADS